MSALSIPPASLPAYFSAYFGQVISPPVLTVPMPPLPPVQPRPPPRSSQSSRHSDSSQSVLFGDAPYILPHASADDELSIAALHRGAPAAASTHSVASGSSGHAPPTTTVTGTGVIIREHPYSDAKSTQSSSGSSGGGASVATHAPRRTSSKAGRLSTDAYGPGHGHGHGRASAAASARTRSASDASMASMASKRAAAISDLAAVSTTIGERAQIELFPIDGLLMFDLHSLCLHLRRALGVVLSLREAMWDELAAVWDAKPAERSVDLEKYGFSYSEDTLESARGKFVALLDQYKRCAPLDLRVCLFADAGIRCVQRYARAHVNLALARALRVGLPAARPDVKGGGDGGGAPPRGHPPRPAARGRGERARAALSRRPRARRRKSVGTRPADRGRCAAGGSVMA